MNWIFSQINNIIDLCVEELTFRVRSEVLDMVVVLFSVNKQCNVTELYHLFHITIQSISHNYTIYFT